MSTKTTKIPTLHINNSNTTPYYSSYTFQTISIPVVPVTIGFSFSPTETQIEDVMFLVSDFVVDFGSSTKQRLLMFLGQHIINIIGNDNAESKELVLDSALKKMVENWMIFFNAKNGCYEKFPDNICKKCRHEIKERELFLSTTISCLC